MTGTIRVIHVDDEPGFAALAASFLEREDRRFAVETAGSATEGLARLADGEFDCVVSDYDMPGRNGIQFLERVREAYPELPFILFTGKGSEEVASDAISAGVTDYLQKETGTDQYAVLANRVRNAVERARAQHDRRRQLDAIETAREGIGILDESGRFIYVNRAYAELYGYDPEGLVGKRWESLYRAEDAREIRRTVLAGGDGTDRWSGVATGLRADGSTFLGEHVFATTERGELVCTVRDVSDLEAYKRELREERTFIEQALNALEEVFYVVGSDGTVRRWNDRFAEVTGYADEEIGETEALEFFPGDERERVATAIEETLSTGRARVRADVRTAGGDRVPHEFTGARLTDPEGEPRGFVGIGRAVGDAEPRDRELETVQRRFDAVFHSPLAFMALLEPDGTVTDANETALEFVDRSIDAVRGEPFPETPWWTHSGELQAELRSWIERAATGETVRYEAEHRAPDGERIVVDGVLHPIRGDDGTVVSLLAAGRDISEREEREQAIGTLHDASRELITADSEARIAEMIAETATDLLDLPHTSVHLYDADRDALVPAGRTDAVTEDGHDPPTLDPDGPARRAFEDGEIRTYDLEAREGDVLDAPRGSELVAPLGRHGVVVVTADEPDAFDGSDRRFVELLCGNAAAALDRVSREQLLRQRERELERYETIIEALGDPVYVVDTDGRYTFVNDALVERTGYDREELLGEHVSKVLPEADVERGRDVLRGLLAAEDRRTTTWEMTRVAADGERIPTENHIALLPSDEDGNFRGSAGVLRDISERKGREQELERQNERLEEFASVISHDLRNPLAVAKGHLELARDERDSEPLESVSDALDRMDALIEDLLALAREGEQVSELEPVELATVGRECWSTVETAEATLTVETGLTVRADQNRLQQLLENLYRNAIEHGGADVTITLGDREEATGFYVEDDGAGIPEGKRERVFEYGYSTAEAGTGFGLAIVKTIADAHGWTVEVTDGPDGGARFEVGTDRGADYAA